MVNRYWVVQYRKPAVKSNRFWDFEKARVRYNHCLKQGSLSHLERHTHERIRGLPVEETKYVVADTLVEWRVKYRGHVTRRRTYTSQAAAREFVDQCREAGTFVGFTEMTVQERLL